MAARGSTIGGEAGELTAAERHAARCCTRVTRFTSCDRRSGQHEVYARCMLAALVGLRVHKARLHEHEALKNLRRR